MRYAEFTGFQPFQDRAFTFCTWDQLEKELNYYLQFLNGQNMLGIECHWMFLDQVPNDEPHRGWAKGTKVLHQALKKSGMKFDVVPQEGMFGPRLQGIFPDPLGRPLPGPTLELECCLDDTVDFEAEELKNLVLIVFNASDSVQRVVMLLLQWNKGVLPSWLNP